MTSTVAVPQSVPGLVTKQLLVMTFLEGEQITRIKVDGAALCLFEFCFAAPARTACACFCMFCLSVGCPQVAGSKVHDVHVFCDWPFAVHSFEGFGHMPDGVYDAQILLAGSCLRSRGAQLWVLKPVCAPSMFSGLQYCSQTGTSAT